MGRGKSILGKREQHVLKSRLKKRHSTHWELEQSPLWCRDVIETRWGGRQRPSRRAGGLADGRSWALVTEQWGTIESFLKWECDIIRFAILKRLFDTFVEKD